MNTKDTTDSVEVINQVLGLFADKTKHSRGAVARNSLGVVVSIHDYDAVCFCVTGAILKSCCDTNMWVPSELSVRIIEELDKRCENKHQMRLVALNDHVGLEAVVKLLTEYKEELEELIKTPA